jgi:hypothetical protein
MQQGSRSNYRNAVVAEVAVFAALMLVVEQNPKAAGREPQDRQSFGFSPAKSF